MIQAHGALVLLLTAALCAHAEPRIQWVPGTERTCVEVSGLDDQSLATVRDWSSEKWRALFSVRVQQDGAPQMLGTWQTDARAVRFSPQFPLTPGVTYRAEFDPARLPGASADAPRLTSEFAVPVPARGPGTVVTHVFPSAEEVPENLLKFYLHFSAPMSRGHIYEHIHLRDEAGKDVELPFLEIDEELWDPEMKRLTLFIDPGRIKRGVRPLEDIGPSLQEGHRFTLAIDAGWLDAAGQPLAQKYERTFSVGPPDRKPIEPAEWKITAPSAGGTDALRIAFPKPMDHALALRLIRVARADGASIEGFTKLSDAERRWTLTPTRPWSPGTYQLIITTTLEDLAGNNVGKPFEVDLRERGELLDFAKSVSLPFEVK